MSTASMIQRSMGDDSVFFASAAANGQLIVGTAHFVSDSFHGVFADDGKPFGRPLQKIDPIFVKSSVRE